MRSLDELRRRRAGFWFALAALAFTVLVVAVADSAMTRPGGSQGSGPGVKAGGKRTASIRAARAIRNRQVLSHKWQKTIAARSYRATTASRRSGLAYRPRVRLPRAMAVSRRR